MISLEKAKELKDAGLEWEPKEGDCLLHEKYGFARVIVLNGSLLDSFVVRTGDGYNISISVDIFSSLTWLPRLDQLLTKIENKFYLWKLHKVGFGVFMILYSGGKAIEPVFNAGTPEDAAAEALIWILRQGKSIVK